MLEVGELFESTFDALELSLTVALIAEWDLIVCTDEATAKQRFNEREDITQLPVRKGEHIVGVWFREDGFRPLDETMLISEATPISQFIPMSGVFRLVLRSGAIGGIVTRSDLNKLPVRLLSFGLITHLEIQMACLINRRYPSDSWLDHLDSKRKALLERRFRHDFAARDWEGRTTRLGCTDLSDKFTVLGEEADFGVALRVDEKQITSLRNKLAHGEDYVWDGEPLENFCKRYELTRKWVERFHELLANEEKTHRSGAAVGGNQ